MEDDHAWCSLFPILCWMIAGAKEAWGRLDHADYELQGAAQDPSDGFARRVLDIARHRVAALRTEDLLPATVPVPVAALRPNRGALVNLKRGLDLLLGSPPSKAGMRSFTGQDPRRWVANVQEAVDHAVCGLTRARSELMAVFSDVDDFLAVPTPSLHGAAQGACVAAAPHARRGAANLLVLLEILEKLHDELEDEPPNVRVRQFFGYVYVDDGTAY